MSGLVLPGGGLERGYSAESREGGFVTATSRVGPRDEDLRGDERADSRLVEQRRADLAHEGKHCQLEVTALGRELLDPGRRASQGEFRGCMLRVRRCVRTQSHASVDELTERMSAEVLAEVDRRGHDERFEHVDCSDPGKFRGIPGDDEGAQTFPEPSRSRCRPRLAPQCFACRAHGVERVRFRAVLRCPGGGVVELDHELALLRQRGRQASTVAAGRLDRPRASFVDRERLGPPERLTVPSSRRGKRRRR